jgi:MFS family permease
MLGSALAGFGTGMFIAPNDSAILAIVPRDKLGVANGIMSVSRTLGILLGSSLGAGFLSARLLASGDFLSSYHELFSVTTVITLVGAALATIRDQPELTSP